MMSLLHLLAVGAVPVFVIASLAMPAGVGGGMLYVPLMILTGVADPRAAAVLAQPIIVGAALAGNIFNVGWQLRHPGKVLLNGNLALAMIAPCLAGNMLGSILNQSMPAVVILVLLLLLICHSFYGSIGRACTMWKVESSMLAPSAPLVESTAPEPHVLGNERSSEPSTRASSREPSDDELAPASIAAETLAEPNVGPDVAEPSSSEIEDEDAEDRPYQQYSFFSSTSPCSAPQPRRRSRAVSEMMETGLSQKVATSKQNDENGSGHTSWCTWLRFIVVWIAMILIGVMRDHSITGVRSCSWEYWLVTLLGFLALLTAGLLTRRPEVGTLKCVAVGCIGACVGIGGAVVLNPMMVKGGVEVQTATATASLLVLVMSSCTTVLFLLSGAVPVLPALTLSLAAFLGSMVGKSIVAFVVKRTGRTSVLVILLSVFIGLSGTAVLVQTGLELMQEVQAGRNLMEFELPC